MRSLSILATATLAYLSIAHAWLVPRQLPACSSPCWATDFIPNGNCVPNDNQCHCEDSVYVQNTLNCITSFCTDPSDVNATISGANMMCESLQVSTAPAGVTTAAPGQPKTLTFTAATTAATASKTGAASAPIGINQQLILFGAAAVAFGVAL